MLGLAPDVRILDLSHEIPAHDVRAGALLLVRAVQYLPDDCVVARRRRPRRRHQPPPGGRGGRGRRAARPRQRPARARGGDGRRRPVGGVARQRRLPPPCARARRSPVATCSHRPPAHLAAGVPLAELGTPVDPAGLVPGLVSLPEVRDDGAIAGEVWWVDRFGNCQLNIDPSELGGWRRAARVARRGAAGGRDPGRPLGAHLRRRQAVGAGAARRLLRPARARPRPRIGGRRRWDCAPAAASHWCPRAPPSTSPSGASREARDDDHDRHPPRPHPRRRHRPVRPPGSGP